MKKANQSVMELTDHIVNPDNDLLKIKVLDKPGAGGAHHEYKVEVPDGPEHNISFQNGTIPEHGVNGITHEALLTIIKHRLECYQSGPFPSDHNAIALSHIKQALNELKARTSERMARGVEGQLKA